MSNGLMTVQASPGSGTIKSLPPTYRALVAESTGQSFSEVARINTLPTPTIAEDEALIRVVYAGVNAGCETFRARGDHAFQGNRKATEPFALGAEGVGIVAAVGSGVTNVKEGDAVCFVGSAFAEYSKCKASSLWSIPEALPEYVGLRISGLTACAMLEQTGKLQKGETVLITAAAGGAGHFAVQFAKLAGCTVIGTCGSSGKAEALEKLGCDHVINYKTQNVAAELKRLAPNGLDAVFEGVGGQMLQTALDALASDGRLLQVGYISEYPHNPDATEESSKNEVDASDLFWKSKTIQRGDQTIYGNAWPKDGTAAGCKDRVLALFVEGKLKSLVDKAPEFSGLESVSDAINHMLSGTSVGKVVVKIGEDS
jgi:NADPH:quinone reductase-like Zn-dependent oxidoreductase